MLGKGNSHDLTLFLFIRPSQSVSSSSSNILFYLGLPTGLASLQGTQGGIYERTEAEERAWRHSDGSWFHLAAARKEIERLP